MTDAPRPRRPLTVLAYLAALVIVIFIAIRLSYSLLPSRDVDPDQPIAGWMTPRYAAEVCDVAETDVLHAIRLTSPMRRRMTIAQIAMAQNASATDMIDSIEALCDSGPSH